MKQKAFDQFETLKGQIDDTQKKIDDFNTKIEKLQQDLGGIDSASEGDIAKRAVEIQEALKEQNIESEKRIALENELAIALANTSDAELDRAQLLQDESQTDRILRQAEERRADLEAQIAEAVVQRDEQLAIQEDLLAQKQQLEQDFTNQFQIELDKRKNAELSAIQEIMAAYAKLKEERASIAGTLTTQGGITEAAQLAAGEGGDFTQTNNFNITDKTSAEDVIRALGASLPK